MSEEHLVPKSVYFAVFAALLALTALTTGVAFIDLGRLNAVVALTIAVVKAILVILFFMHVYYGQRFTWVVVGGGFFWLGVLILFTMSDVLSRGWLGFPGK